MTNPKTMLRHALRTILLAIACVRPASAQARFASTPGPAFALFRPAPTALPAHPEGFINSSAPDYRWEGLVIGAFAGGALAAFFMGTICTGRDSGGCSVGEVLGVPLLGAAAGGLIGGFTGLVTSKNHPASTP